MLDIKIYAGKKSIIREWNQYIFCDDYDDTDSAYNDLAKIELKNPETDLIEFQYLKDDDVKSLLEDAKKHDFISDYSIKIDNEEINLDDY